MKPIFILLKNFKNLLPYFLLISIYFLFINLETRKERINKKNIEIEKQLVEDKSIGYDKKKLRIAIPVVPYKE